MIYVFFYIIIVYCGKFNFYIMNISYGVKVISLEISKWEIFFGINLFI